MSRITVAARLRMQIDERLLEFSVLCHPERPSGLTGNGHQLPMKQRESIR